MACVGRPAIEAPSSVIAPAAGRRYPITVLSVVVFPAPLRPTRHTSSPAAAWIDTLRRMWLASMKTSTSRRASIGLLARRDPENSLDHGGVGADRRGRRIGQRPAPLPPP